MLLQTQKNARHGRTGRASSWILEDMTYIAPVCNYNYAVSHINSLHGIDAVVDFRLIHDTDKGIAAHHYRGTLQSLWNTLCDYNSRGYGVFINLNETDGKGKENKNILSIRAHAVDLDNTATAKMDYARAASSNPPPSFVINTSPDKYHLYWVVKPYQGNERFALLQRKLQRCYNGDKSVIDATRVLRLAGFFHMKNPETPHLVTCGQLSGYGRALAVETLEQAYAHIIVTDGAGGRHALGTPELAAPDLMIAVNALNSIDPNELDRAEWISITAAFKQATSTLDAGIGMARYHWDRWCAEYKSNDPTENEKQWNSIRETELGWNSLKRRTPPDFQARLLGFTPQQSIAPEQQQQVMFLDDATGARHDRLVSSEVYKLVKLDYRMPIALDTFANRIVKRGPMFWKTIGKEWTDSDTAYLRAFLQTTTGKSPSTEALIEGIALVADKNAFNPLTEWLDTLQWDGISRIDEMLFRYFKAENQTIARIVSAKFLIGMIARAYHPGIKRDEVLILEGEQGIGKSTALNIIAGDEYFLDGLPNLHDKDAMQLLQGVWLVELGELAALRRSEVEEVKRFISARTDSFRAPYGRLPEKRARTMVFAATTNASEYLKDPTGARRFWPIRLTGKIDLAGLARDREQLLAEARARFLANERFHLSPDEEQAFSEARDTATEHDAWTDPVMAWLKHRVGPIKMADIFAGALGVPYERQDAGKTRRMAAILKNCGWIRKQINREWQYSLKC